MLPNPKISTRQLFVLVFIFTIGDTVLIAPSFLASQSKQDAWLAAILGTVIGLLFIVLYNRLATQFPEQTLVQICETLLGKWFGKLMSFFFMFYFLVLAGALLREIGDFLTTQIMPETPIQAIVILFMLTSLMGVRLGLEALVRATEIFMPWIMFLFIILILFLIPQIDHLNMKPIFEYGLKPIISGAFPYLGLPYLQLFIFLMIMPFVKDKKNAGKSFLFGAITASILLIAITFFAILVLGSDFTERNAYPTYILGKKVSIANFIERIEVIVAIIWFLTIFFQLSICLWALGVGIAQTCKLSDYRPLVAPISIIAVVLALIMSPNISYYQKFVRELWTPFSLVFGLALPLLLFLIAKFKSKRSSERHRL